MRSAKRKGFTIVELVIIIAVIALLASVLVPVFGGIVTKAKRSSAMQEAKNLLTMLNSAYIAENEGKPLPEGIVLESGGYWFVYIENRLYEIALSGETDSGDTSFSLWSSPQSKGGASEIAAVLNNAPAAPFTITVDGVERECTDIGCVITDTDEYVFAFYSLNGLAVAESGYCCGIYAGSVINTAEWLSVPPDSTDEIPNSSDEPDIPIYSVSFELNNCVADGAPSCSPDHDYSVAVTPDDNFTLSGSPLLTINGAAYNGYTWSGDDVYILTVPKEDITGDITVSVTAQGKSFSFGVTAVGCTVDSANGSTQYGTDLTLTFLPAGGYKLDGAAVTVIAGDTSLSANNGYSWNHTNGVLVIDGEYVTGNLQISLSAVRIQYEFTWNSYDGSEILDINGVATKKFNENGNPIEYYINSNEDFSFKIVNYSTNCLIYIQRYVNSSWRTLSNESHYTVSQENNYLLVTIYGEYITGPIDVEIYSE